MQTICVVECFQKRRNRSHTALFCAHVLGNQYYFCLYLSCSREGDVRGRRIPSEKPDRYSGFLQALFLFFLFFSFFFLANSGSSMRMYPYVSRMHSYVPVCHSYVTRMSLVCHSYVPRMSLVCHSYVTRMSLVCRGGGGGGQSLLWTIRRGFARKGYPFLLEVYERVGISRVEILKRVGKTVL